MTPPWESPRTAVGPLKVLRKAAEPPAGGSRRMPKTLKATNHLRRRGGRAFTLRSVVGTQQPINAQFRTCDKRASDCGLSSDRDRAEQRPHPPAACNSGNARGTSPAHLSLFLSSDVAEIFGPQFAIAGPACRALLGRRGTIRLATRCCGLDGCDSGEAAARRCERISSAGAGLCAPSLR